MNSICKCGKPTEGMYACAECREKIAAYKRKWRANMTEFQHEKELEKHRVWRKKNYETLKTYNHEYYLRRKYMDKISRQIFEEWKKGHGHDENYIPLLARLNKNGEYVILFYNVKDKLPWSVQFRGSGYYTDKRYDIFNDFVKKAGEEYREIAFDILLNGDLNDTPDLVELKRQRTEIDKKIKDIINNEKYSVLRRGSISISICPYDGRYAFCCKNDLIVFLDVCGINTEGVNKHVKKPICFGKNKKELSTKLESIINDLSELKNKLESEDEENGSR